VREDDGVHPLITPAELAQVLGTVTVLDVRYRLGGPPGRGEFEAGHVPGAAFVDLDRDLAAPPGEGGRHPLPDRATFEAAMRAAGVSADRPVVVLDDWSGHAAARARWLLRHHGHRDVRVLDGGWSAWTAAGGEVETGATAPTPGDFTAGPGVLPVVEADDVPGVAVLVDARAPERYRGETEPVDPVAGHVPGAVNVPTARNLTADGRLRDAAELRELYAAVGAVPGADVAVYCGSGVTACLDLLALEVAGVEGAALYPGSWSGWVTDPERPIETGLETGIETGGAPDVTSARP
jgi:thiosulfate/3-mercaptopyruvate sulfurtransferase